MMYKATVRRTWIESTGVASGPADHSSTGNEARRIRLLLVEDEIIAALDAENILTDLGYEVCGMAASGPEAVAAAQKLRPDLVLMDIRLAHNTDGIQAAGEIRRNLGIPSVFLTAHSDPVTIRRAETTDPLGFVTKPYSVAQLEMTLRKAVEHLRQNPMQ